MDTALASKSPATPVVFEDALGTRRRVDAPEPLEFFALTRELTAVPSFEFSLRERASRLAAFRHPSFARVRSIDRLSDAASTLAIVSEAPRGVRLSSLLAETRPPGTALDVHISLHLIRQLVGAVAVLHESGRDVAHGALGPERIIVTPNARVVVAEYVLGAALEQLRLPVDRYWRDLRIAVAPAAGAARFDQRTDVAQVGIVSLSLVLGRLLREDEYPDKASELVASAWAISPRGGLEPLPPGVRAWLLRTLQLDSRHPFVSAAEARVEFEKVVAGEDIDQEFVVAMPREEPAIDVRPPASKPPAAARSDVKPRALPAGAVSSGESWRASGRARLASPRVRSGPLAAAAILLVLLSTGAVLGARHFFTPPSPPVVPVPPSTGTLSITTAPADAEVFVDGVGRGRTPVTLTLNAGTHGLELRGTGEPRAMTVSMTPGAQLAQYIELPSAPAAPPPAAAAVAAPAAAVERPVPVESQFGWVSVTAPVDVQLFENQRLIGTSQSDRVMVSAGRHDIEIVNDALGYRATRTVQVPPGKVAPIRIDWPKGTMSVNALPWAEVWVDGERVGETPIGNLSLPIGPHEIVFRHPELGEQRHAATVTVNTPARVSVDLRRK